GFRISDFGIEEISDFGNLFDSAIRNPQFFLGELMFPERSIKLGCPLSQDHQFPEKLPSSPPKERRLNKVPVWDKEFFTVLSGS
ncbi:MAG: hypothetical protein ACPGWR_32665, partial [Ardenticatenaceae bacterium]